MTEFMTEKAAALEIARLMTDASNNRMHLLNYREEVRELKEQIAELEEYKMVAALLAMDIDLMYELSLTDPDDSTGLLKDLKENRDAAIADPRHRYSFVQELFHIPKIGASDDGGKKVKAKPVNKKTEAKSPDRKRRGKRSYK